MQQCWGSPLCAPVLVHTLSVCVLRGEPEHACRMYRVLSCIQAHLHIGVKGQQDHPCGTFSKVAQVPFPTLGMNICRGETCAYRALWMWISPQQMFPPHAWRSVFQGTMVCLICITQELWLGLIQVSLGVLFKLQNRREEKWPTNHIFTVIHKCGNLNILTSTKMKSYYSVIFLLAPFQMTISCHCLTLVEYKIVF